LEIAFNVCTFPLTVALAYPAPSTIAAAAIAIPNVVFMLRGLPDFQRRIDAGNDYSEPRCAISIRFRKVGRFPPQRAIGLRSNAIGRARF